MTPDLATIDSLKREWSSLQPLSPENDRRLWDKLRLEWNYNSTHIEGNTLTYGETKLLLIHDRTTGDHQLREYEEMKAHDLGIAYIRKLAKAERFLGEKDIRDLNKVILKEPFWGPAITSDGQETRKLLIPGDYKKSPNSVRTPTGEIHNFVSPEDTPPRMRELVMWLRENLKSEALHPIELVAKLHHDLLVIHPFDDGNGRVARLLMNYVLLRFGYPPIIIKSADKAGYLSAIRKADAGDLSALTTYLAIQLKAAFELGFKAARGDSVEEPSDVEKEIAVFIRDQQALDKVKGRSREILAELLETSFRNLFQTFEEKISKLFPLFVDHSIMAQPTAVLGKEDWQGSLEHFILERPDAGKFEVIISMRGYRRATKTPFNMECDLGLILDDFEYQVRTRDGITSVNKLYSEPLLAEEAEAIVNKILKAQFESIKKKAAKT